MRVFLEVDKGPGSGTRYRLSLNGYRAVGRSGDAPVTAQFSQSGERQLQTDDLQRVEAHLRARVEPDGQGNLELRLGKFKRGEDILFADEKISRTHAMFFLDDKGPSAVDLMSTNGTLVNGERIGDADLAEGDLVNIGSTRFVVRFGEES